MRRLPATILAALLVLPTTAGAEEPERVVMKLDEFLKLYEATKEKEAEAPRDHALASARYSGRVLVEDGRPHAATFKAKLHVEVLRKKGWARVPVLPATVALQSATIDGKEAAVVIEDGYYTLVTERRGAFDLQLEFAAAVTTAQGRSSLAFDLAPSGATELELAVPADQDLDFTVANARLSSDKVVGSDRVVTATLPATGSLSVSWQVEIPEAAKQDARVYAEVYTLVGIGDGLLRTTTTVQDTILFAGVNTLRFSLPKDMTLLDVTGSGIRDWNLKDGTLEVVLNYAAEGAYSLQLQMEKVVGEKSQDLQAPVVVPLGVERAKGWVGVEARGNLEVGAGEVKGATAVDVRSLPAAILGITDQPVLLGYKYLGAEPAIPLTVAQHDDVDVLVTLLDETQARTMWTQQGRRLTSVQYRVRNNRRQFLRLALPEGAELWSASVGGRAVQPAKASDGRVMVPLLRSQSTGGSLAAFEVEVVYVESTDATPDNGRGHFAGTLPQADAPSTYVVWRVHSPEGTKIKKRSADGSLRMVEYPSNPIPSEDEYYIETDTPMYEQQAVMQSDSGGLGTGAVPVQVSLPVQGEPVFFEKLLALDEPLTVEFDYKGLRK
ncbi:hypothetical protein [Paraliomyxa miuraensis]|uniref:hypothetical protein n=1 Tax=Paraliomyxa miuraensis TaxID=376150 RepID=UPI00224E74E4|nr:hypothetical protein [Paraliomyxa miuraensis]MCX4245132.1 hypothetical protein [Paraliomyxa miuraensis]